MTDVPKPPSDEERTTDENESSSSPPAESPSAAATPSSTAPVSEPAAPFSETKPAETTPVEVPVESQDEEAEEGEDEEPLEATRLSPYSVGSFAVALVSLFQAPTTTFNLGAQAIPTSQLLRFVLPTMLLPFLAAVISLWLSFRGEEEIFVAGGRFGGVGLYRAARVIAIATLVIIAAVIVVLTVLAEQPQPQLGQFG